MSEKWDLIIFDCDGVLVDSEPISSGTLIEMLAEIGLSMSPQEASEVFMGAVHRLNHGDRPTTTR